MKIKTYYRYVKEDDGFCFMDEGGNIIRFAGKPKLFLKSLYQLFGKEKTSEFIDMFEKAAENINNILPKGGTFVLYKYNNTLNKNVDKK